MTEFSLCFEAFASLASLPEAPHKRLLDRWAREVGELGADSDGVLGLLNVRDRLPAAMNAAVHGIHDLSDEAGLDQLLQVRRLAVPD